MDISSICGMVALAKDTLVLQTIRGGTCDSSSMRPGYCMATESSRLLNRRKLRWGVIYSIPAEHPVHFTHFWPRVKFDRTHMEGSWFFRSPAERLCLHMCSGSPEPFGDQLFD